MMSNQFVQGGAQMSLVAAGSLSSDLRRKAHTQTTSDHSQRINMRFTQMLFFRATNTTFQLRPVLHLLCENLNNDNPVCCSLD